jgi:hypothetical protein
MNLGTKNCPNKFQVTEMIFVLKYVERVLNITAVVLLALGLLAHMVKTATILTIMISRNSWKSIISSSRLFISLSSSLISLTISSLDGSNPRALKTTLRFFASIVPHGLAKKFREKRVQTTIAILRT